VKKTGLLRNVLSHGVFIINLLVIAWLACCYAASYTSPLRVKYLALFSLTTPFAIAANCCFIIFWLFTRRKWRLFFSLAPLCIFYKLVLAVVGLHFGKNDLQAGAGRLKVMTWNVHGLGIYDHPVDKTVPDRILEVIKEQQPDILCLTEFYTNWDNAMTPHTGRFLQEGGFKEYRFIYDNTLGTKIYVGTAFYSRYPLSNFKTIQLARNIKMLQCDVTLPGKRKMRNYFIHLQSFMLQDNEKNLIEEVKNNNRSLEMSESKSFARRFNAAYEKRAVQTDSAAGIIAQSPYPVLICGDLNDLPGSYTYTTLRGKLGDAFAEQGLGLGRTYNRILPTLRIDYIFYDPAMLHITGFKSPRLSALSDHNPVIACFELK
jgi:endonuclease/exonuclease/phosphatase family metal-dependent hydrolase